MGLFSTETGERPPPLGGGPLGLGDPDDRRLRKTEKDVIIANMMREEAEKRCQETIKIFAKCAKETGFLVFLKCRKENDAHNECLIQYLKNPEFVDEITEKYLHARSHYRRTGEPLVKYERKKRSTVGIC